MEICLNGVYGTVCDDKWNILDAKVVCRKIGFSENSTYQQYTTIINTLSIATTYVLFTS